MLLQTTDYMDWNQLLIKSSKGNLLNIFFAPWKEEQIKSLNFLYQLNESFTISSNSYLPIKLVVILPDRTNYSYLPEWNSTLWLICNN